VVSFDASRYNGQVGDIIKFITRDDFGVARVIVTLADDEAGTLIETGEGVQEVANTSRWMYTVTKPVPAGVLVSIQIDAFDRPGGMGRQRGTKKI